MAVDGETLLEYSIRIGLATPTMMRSTRMDRIDEMIERKSEYPPEALRLLNEVEERRRNEEDRKKTKQQVEPES